MGAAVIFILPCGLCAGRLVPFLTKQRYKFSRCIAVRFVRSHIIASGIIRILILLCRQHQVHCDRFQHMLIRPCGIRIPDNNLPVLQYGAHTVRNDPVCREITAADYIARTCRRNRRRTLRHIFGMLLRLEIRIPVTACHQFRARFRIGIRIIAIQFLILPISPLPLFIQVYFIRGNVHKRAHTRMPADALQHIDCPHHIYFISIDRIAV